MAFDNLPLELKLEVFSYLSTSELCTTSIVCKKWYEVAMNPLLWKKVKISDKNLRKPTLLNRCTLVRELKFYNLSNWAWLPKLSTKHHFLRSLEFAYCSLYKRPLSELIRQFPNVESVVIKSCRGLGNKNFGEITKWKRLKRFCEFGLIDFDNLHFDGNKWLVFLGNECQNLEESLTDNWEIQDRALETFMNARKTTLKKININCRGLTEKGFNSLLLAPLTGLTVTQLSRPTELCVVLQKMTHLETLKIRTTEYFEPSVDTRYFHRLFKKVTFHNLRNLEISFCLDGLDDVTVKLITKSCPSLRTLQLICCTEYTDRGLKVIVENCRNLEVLQIAHSKLKGYALRYIPSTMKKLRILDVAGCKRMNREILNEVAEKVPKLDVIHPKTLVMNPMLQNALNNLEEFFDIDSVVRDSCRIVRD